MVEGNDVEMQASEDGQTNNRSKTNGGHREWKLGDHCKVKNSVQWSDDNLLSVIAGRSVEIFDPSRGPRCSLTLSSGASAPWMDASDNLLADVHARAPAFVTCAAWSPSGLSANSGCVLIVCGSDGSAALFQIPEQSLDVGLSPTLCLFPHLFDLYERGGFSAKAIAALCSGEAQRTEGHLEEALPQVDGGGEEAEEKERAEASEENGSKRATRRGNAQARGSKDKEGGGRGKKGREGGRKEGKGSEGSKVGGEERQRGKRGAAAEEEAREEPAAEGAGETEGAGAGNERGVEETAVDENEGEGEEEGGAGDDGGGAKKRGRGKVSGAGRVGKRKKAKEEAGDEGGPAEEAEEEEDGEGEREGGGGGAGGAGGGAGRGGGGKKEAREELLALFKAEFFRLRAALPPDKVVEYGAWQRMSKEDLAIVEAAAQEPKVKRKRQVLGAKEHAELLAAARWKGPEARKLFQVELRIELKRSAAWKAEKMAKLEEEKRAREEEEERERAAREAEQKESMAQGEGEGEGEGDGVPEKKAEGEGGGKRTRKPTARFKAGEKGRGKGKGGGKKRKKGGEEGGSEESQSAEEGSGEEEATGEEELSEEERRPGQRRRGGGRPSKAEKRREGEEEKVVSEWVGREQAAVIRSAGWVRVLVRASEVGVPRGGWMQALPADEHARGRGGEAGDGGADGGEAAVGVVALASLQLVTVWAVAPGGGGEGGGGRVALLAGAAGTCGGVTATGWVTVPEGGDGRTRLGLAVGGRDGSVHVKRYVRGAGRGGEAAGWLEELWRVRGGGGWPVSLVLGMGSGKEEAGECRLAIASGSRVRVWRGGHQRGSGSGEEASAAAHRSQVTGLGCDASGSVLVSCSEDGAVSVWQDGGAAHAGGEEGSPEQGSAGRVGGRSGEGSWTRGRAARQRGAGLLGAAVSHHGSHVALAGRRSAGGEPQEKKRGGPSYEGWVGVDRVREVLGGDGEVLSLLGGVARDRARGDGGPRGEAREGGRGDGAWTERWWWDLRELLQEQVERKGEVEVQRALRAVCGPSSSCQSPTAGREHGVPVGSDAGSQRVAVGGGPLHSCARRGDGWACAVLVGLRADVNAVDGQGATPLMLAALGGHREAMEAILQARPDLEVRDVDGFSSLEWAVVRQHAEAVRALVRAGAKVDGGGGPLGALQLAEGGDERVKVLLRGGEGEGEVRVKPEPEPEGFGGS